jgi:hypothetical protein
MMSSKSAAPPSATGEHRHPIGGERHRIGLGRRGRCGGRRLRQRGAGERTLDRRDCQHPDERAARHPDYET